MLLALIVGTFVSEDLACIGAGLLIAGGQLPPVPALVACAAGIYLGDLGLYAAGRIVGGRVLRWRRVSRVLPAGGAARFARWFDARAGRVVLASRFAPGTRLPLYLAAGASRCSIRSFSLWTAVAAAIWTPALVGASAFAGSQARGWLLDSLSLLRIAVPAAGLAVLVIWRTMLALTVRRERQRLWARVQRIWRWEFWPMWLFYAPVAGWIAWLTLRYGGLTTITAANPGIADGGVVGESKFDILSLLPSRWTVPSAIVESGHADTRVETFRERLREHGWTLPIVLKPDVGQRGSGVRLARTMEEAAAYLAGTRERVVVQPFHPGPFEAGVFYYRWPGAARGQILAITDKHFPQVVGDGTSTLEDLVWAHPRYRMQARTFLARLGARAHEVPDCGAVVRIGIAGNHAQGTLFTDGRALLTPALERRIDEISQAFDGFFIGRFDIRYSDRAAFMGGEDLAIVELNGATGECTSIYDPAGTLWSAYRLLFRQWHLVFAIGAANRRAGKPASSRERLVALLREHLASTPSFPVAD